MSKLFEFASATVSAREYVLDAYLNGTFHEQKDLTVYGSPYTLGLRIRCHDGRFEPEAAVVAVRIMDASDGEVVFEGNDTLKMQTQCDSNGRYCTYVTSEEIDLEFKDYLVIVRLRVTLPLDQYEEELELHLKTKYREYRSNDLFEMIMSV